MSDLGNKAIMVENIQRLMDSRGIDRNTICADLGFKYTTFTYWAKEHEDECNRLIEDIDKAIVEISEKLYIPE